MTKRQSIRFEIKQQIWGKPCAVCGVSYNINVDHVVPVAKGGSSDTKNLQALCYTCNHIKGCRLNNRQVAGVIATRGLNHFLSAVYDERTGFLNPYDRPTLERWMRMHPGDRLEANTLLDAFLMRCSHA